MAARLPSLAPNKKAPRRNISPQPRKPDKTDVYGFDKLHESLKKLTHRMPGKSLQEKWGRVGSYIDGFYYDDESAAAAQLALQVYSKYKRHAGHLSSPNIPLTAVSCVMLEQCLHWTCRFQPEFLPLVNALRDEFFSALFLDPPATQKISVEDVPRLDANSVEMEVERFLSETYFAVYRKYKVAAEESSEKAGQQSNELQALSEESGYWKDAYKRKIFTGWRVQVNATSRMKKFEENVTRNVSSKIKKLETDNQELGDMPVLVAGLRDELKKANDAIYSLEKKVEALSNQASYWENEAKKFQTLNIEIPRLAQKNKELQLDVDRSRIKAVQLSQLLFLSLQEIQAEPMHYERLQTNTHLLESALPSEQILLKWVNSLLEHSLNGSEMCLRNFSGGFKLLDPLLVLVRQVSPFHFPEKDLEKALGSDSASSKVDILFNILTEMKLPVIPCKKGDLLKDVTTASLHSLLSVLFMRFCGAQFRSYDGTLRISHDITEGSYFFGLSHQAMLNNEKVFEESEDWDIMKWNDWKNKVLQQYRETKVWSCFGSSIAMQKLYMATLSDNVDRDDASQTKKLLGNITPGLLQAILGETTLHAIIEQTVKDLQQCVKNHFDELAGIFRYYATTGQSAKTGANAMGLNEFWRFCNDTQLVGKKRGLTRERVRDLFALANQVEHRDTGSSLHIDDTTDLDGSGDDMSPAEFIEALIHISNAVYSGAKYCSLTLGEKFDTLLKEEVVFKATKCRTDTFKRMLYDDKSVVNALKAYNKYLVEIFNYYKTRNMALSETNTNNDLSLDEFLIMCDDSVIIDASFNRNQAKDVFVKIQENLQMMFHEFLEALVAIACFKNASPFMPLEQKMKNFMEVQYLPRIQHKFKSWPKEIKVSLAD